MIFILQEGTEEYVLHVSSPFILLSPWIDIHASFTSSVPCISSFIRFLMSKI